ncbi:22749_t:CDS:2, partial [Gigaspora rosea]
MPHESFASILQQSDNLNHTNFESSNTTENNNLPLREYWRPSSKLQRLYNKFQNNILTQWPRIACIYYSRLLYPKKASWIIHNPTIIYPIQQHIPNVLLSFDPNLNHIKEPRVPVCDACKKPSTRFQFFHLSPIPAEIMSVLLHMRKNLSPVHLHCSLGRTPNSNPYTEYRSLTSAMGYSHNIRAHALYAGSLDAFLEPNNNNNTNNNLYDTQNYNSIMQRAANWLAENNPYLHPFTALIPR